MKRFNLLISIFFSTAFYLLTSGCAEEIIAEPTDTICVPDREAFEMHARPAFEKNCGTCHGAVQDYGAPMSLLNYDEMIAGEPGERLVDKVTPSLNSRSMPPAPFGAPGHTDFDTMVLWSTCGMEHPDYQEGLTANAPVFLPPSDLPTETDVWTISANEFHVSPDWNNRYQCWAVDVPFDEPQLIKRFEMQLDDTRVLHHAVLYRDPSKRHNGSFRCSGVPSNTDFLYGWAPGQDAIQFPEGGLLVEPGERYVFQIHYNNSAGIENVKDKTSINIYHGPTGSDETEYGMIVPGPNMIMVSPESSMVVTGVCDIKEEITLLAGMPHMHETGMSFSSDVVRADGTRINLIELTGWSFEAQLFYEMPITLYPGDQLETTCGFYNPHSDRTVFFGDGTEDEMCFNFLYATPTNGMRFCNDRHIFK